MKKLSILCLLLVACAHIVSRPAAYTTELEECNRKSNTLKESVDCENEVRIKYNRPLRDAGVE